MTIAIASNRYNQTSIGQVARSARLGGKLVLLAKLISNLFSSGTGAGTSTFTRASAATVVDFEGVLRTVRSGESRFQGTRRVENLFRYSENNTNGDFYGAINYTSTITTIALNATNSYWVKGTQAILSSGSVIIAQVILASAINQTVCIRVANRNNGSNSILTNVALTSVPQLVSLTLTLTSASIVVIGIDNRASAGATNTAPISAITFTKVQIENVTGQSVQTPGDYTSTNVLSSPYYGANVDGVQYFTNRLDGTAITGATIGYLSEPSRTNLFLNSAVGATQNITSAAGQVTLSFYGTGTIMLTGTAAGTLVGTGANTRVSLTVTDTAGVVVCTVTGSTTNVQFEAGASASSYIATVGSAVTRVADVDTVPLTIPDGQGTLILTLTVPGINGNAINPGIALDSGSTTNQFQLYAVPGASNLSLNVVAAGTSVLSDAAFISSLTPNTVYKIAIRWGAGTVSRCINAGVITSTAGVVLPTSLNRLNLASGASWFGTVTNVNIYKTALSDSLLQKLTT